MTTTPKDDKGFEDLLPLEARRFAAGEWTIHGKDGQQLFEVQGAAFSDWLVKTLNEGQIALQVLSDSAALRVHLLRNWTDEQIQNLAFGLLGDEDRAKLHSGKTAEFAKKLYYLESRSTSDEAWDCFYVGAGEDAAIYLESIGRAERHPQIKTWWRLLPSPAADQQEEEGR
jgi:hypothetical protein